MRKVRYENLEERERLIAEAESNDEILVEDAIYFDGNFLLFEHKLSLEDRTNLKLAQNTVETLELISALNELQKLEQAQSNAELIELMLSIKGGI